MKRKSKLNTGDNYPLPNDNLNDGEEEVQITPVSNNSNTNNGDEQSETKDKSEDYKKRFYEWTATLKFDSNSEEVKRSVDKMWQSLSEDVMKFREIGITGLWKENNEKMQQSADDIMNKLTSNMERVWNAPVDKLEESDLSLKKLLSEIDKVSKTQENQRSSTQTKKTPEKDENQESRTWQDRLFPGGRKAKPSFTEQFTSENKSNNSQDHSR